MASDNHFSFTKPDQTSPDQLIRRHYDHYDQLQWSSATEALSPAEKISSPVLAPFPPSLFLGDRPMAMAAQDQYLHLSPPFPPQAETPSTINDDSIDIGPTHSVFGLSTDIGEDILPLLLDHQDTISTCWPIATTTGTPTANPFSPQVLLTESSSVNVNLDKQQNNHMYPTIASYPSISNNYYRDPIPAAVPVPVSLGYIQNIPPPPPPANSYDDHLNSETTLSAMYAVIHEVESNTTTSSTTLVDSKATKKEETNDMMVSPVHRAGRNKKQNNNNNNQKIEVLKMDEIMDYFEVPISKAAKELNVGLTVLKKRCRELRIKRWPHRKIKSLRGLIMNVQELGLVDEVAVLEEQIRMLKKLPQLELTEYTKKLRQACFKANYKKRRMASCPLLSAITRTPCRRRR